MFGFKDFNFGLILTHLPPHETALADIVVHIIENHARNRLVEYLSIGLPQASPPEGKE